ncbi:MULTISPECIES: peptidoglycan DD-transpeptidase MrdA [Plesiomonas]|uniref:Peptidoglycan D,D-transpeptidase MrdA n=2 Tax=Plesiomonas shigelloides TaxID=703 RepID=R8ANI4_PLESH|nr:MULTISPECIES: peptidoglycan DD-transpeptidase MrdA [Plesiomonas]MDO4687667.1 peptidoglycan DD-transpeptidase MrdA [Plesiomonas sp.]EON87907.1 transpeptidase [Plesiomonas shigelloides 302-73]KAB7669500.1 peptidoglycan DD-transpeptidase MrdA [Plesiomonas shigelloides]KAB7688605.1 peptidoglycan DD-transpeptidase MrdA [Plesiomonas shigelloides]KAB7696194.1 peptidoglycan DD-transpeptidase MrdA [Plesiomonas shigelloides]
MKQDRTHFRDHSSESALFFRRAIVAFIGILLLSGVLVANLYHLQVQNYEDYQTRSNDNRIKLLPIPPSRGLIYDRNGILLAENRTVFQLEMVPEKVDSVDKTLAALRPIVGLTDEDIANFRKERKRSRRFSSIPIKTPLNEEQVARFAINQYLFPGVEVKGYLKRYYPYGEALTHVIGYVAKINDKDVERLDKEGRLANYAGTHDIGKLGIEKYYENILHGQVGSEEVEVNNRGKVIRKLREQPATAGQNITLSLDLELQQYIERILGKRRGAVVVMDPRDGSILAMVSSPSYDPNLFVNGIPSKTYSALLNDPDRPLINRTTQGTYPPASTVKPLITVAALESGAITTKTTLFDPGWWKLPGSEKRYRDWKKWGHGQLNITKAIEESADTFFYQVAYDMGIDRLSEWMKKFGFGQYTGVDISEERSGVMPSREWKMARYRKPWYQGDTIPVGIGQGYWTATPLQLAKAMTILINDGEVKPPHLLKSIQGNGITMNYPEENLPSIGVKDSGYWEIAKDGMYGVNNRPNGTARRSFAGTPYKSAGKSGTAQVFSLAPNQTYDAKKLANYLHDHAWFTGFAPYDNPQVVVSILLENAGGGSTNGAPIARKIFDHILLGKNDTDLPAATQDHTPND